MAKTASCTLVKRVSFGENGRGPWRVGKRVVPGLLHDLHRLAVVAEILDGGV